MCPECDVASLWAPQRRLLMWGFIYLTDLLLEGKDYGGSCCGAEGTAVPQCSVPHYCFLMRRSEGLQQVSHLALHRMTVCVVPHISDDALVSCEKPVWENCALFWKTIVTKQKIDSLHRLWLTFTYLYDGEILSPSLSTLSNRFCSSSGYFPEALLYDVGFNTFATTC